jgi:hypothetical protein
MFDFDLYGWSPLGRRLCTKLLFFQAFIASKEFPRNPSAFLKDIQSRGRYVAQSGKNKNERI